MSGEWRCGHSICTDRYDEPNRCTLNEGHDGEHTDGYYVWTVQRLEGNSAGDTGSVQ